MNNLEFWLLLIQYAGSIVMIAYLIYEMRIDTTREIVLVVLYGIFWIPTLIVFGGVKLWEQISRLFKGSAV